MKKSKIIIPALGVLVLSTAASITGTVAWFTANRAATVTTGQFAVINTDGNLAYDITALVGTTAAKSNNSLTYYDTINLKTNVKLGDSSFNPNTLQLWNDTGDGTKFRTIGDGTSYKAADSSHPWQLNATTYHAVSWKIVFTYTFGADQTDLNILFNPAESTMTKSKQDELDDGTIETGLGFRIALFAEGATKKIIWSDNQVTAKMESVTGATTHGLCSGLSNVTVFDSATSAAYTKIDDESNAQKTNSGYLGSIGYDANPANCTLTVNCVAWYEGTDENVITDEDTLMQQVQSTLKFYATVGEN